MYSTKKINNSIFRSLIFLAPISTTNSEKQFKTIYIFFFRDNLKKKFNLGIITNYTYFIPNCILLIFIYLINFLVLNKLLLS